MKTLRLTLIAVAAIVVLVVIAVATLFSSGFQTWAARRALASTPGLKATIGSVSAGLHRIEVKDLRLERDGAVLTLPSAAAELPVIDAAFRQRILLSRFSANGWTLDLTRWQSASPAARVPSASTSMSLPAANPEGPAAAAGAPLPPKTDPPAAPNTAPFHGIFDQLKLPIDLALDGVEITGVVLLPDRGRAQVAVSGGGLSAGREGRFRFSGDIALADAAVSAVQLRGTLIAGMDTPRTVVRIGFQGDATASGPKFPQGVKLAADAAAARTPAGETYSVGMTTDQRQLALLQADFPRGGAQFTGTWKIDLKDSDLAAFTFGRALPQFSTAGEGKFDLDAGLAALHLTGRLDGAVDRLNVILPQLADVGAVRLVADFDLARRGDAITVQKLNADVAGDRPVATVRALQAFEFNPQSAELKAVDPARELLGIALHAVPLAWARPFLHDLTFTGGDLRGELVASMRTGGTWIRTTSPLTIAGASVGQSGRNLVEGLDLALSASADYTPQGWQAEITELIARSAGATVLDVAGKAGQLAGKDQPLKATGRLKADLPGVLRQPVAGNLLALTQGKASIDFIASLGAKKELHAKVALADLAVPAEKPAGGAVTTLSAETAPAAAATSKLPAISAEIRTDIAANGQVTLSAPVVLEREQRKSDLTIAGTLTPQKDVRTIDAQVTSDHLVIEDAQVLAALLPSEKPKTPEGRPTAPAWAGFRGTLGLQLKDVVYSQTFQARNVVGTLRLEESGLKLEGFRVMLGEGDAKINGEVTFDRAAPQPYAVTADLVVLQFDPGPLFRALNPQQAPTIEGKFDVKSQLSGRAATLGALAAGAGGEFELTSRGGVFRGVPVNVNHIVENTSRLAGWLASAGTALGALTGKKDTTDVAGKAQAVAELAKGLNAIPFDQLAVVLSRDEKLNTTLTDFTLISPEIRLSGCGRAMHEPGSNLLDDSLAMEFTLRARGRQGELLKYLGALDAHADDLGYARCTVPIEISGTLGKPDASAFSNRVAALAIERSGLADKASEILNRIRGGGAK